jgi:hypothetical protein
MKGVNILYLCCGRGPGMGTTCTAAALQFIRLMPFSSLLACGT